MQQVIIDFGGFYGSLHEAFIEDAMWADDDGGESLTDSDENIDWDAVKNTYSEAYLDKLCEFTASELGMESVYINYKGLDSPSYYNFATDVIIGEISDEDSLELMNAIQKDDELLEYIQKRTKSYDGYISFYTFDEVLENKDNALIEFTLDFMSGKYNEEELFNDHSELIQAIL